MAWKSLLFTVKIFAISAAILGYVAVFGLMNNYLLESGAPAFLRSVNGFAGVFFATWAIIYTVTPESD